VLQKDGKDVFALTAGAGFRALFSGGRSITDLQLSEPAWKPAGPGDEEIRPVPDLGDGVTADRLAGDAHLIPGLWKVDGYDEVGEFLRKRFGLVRGQSYFEFPYDWRRDNRVAAHQLAASCRQWLASRRQQYPDAQLMLLGHSMGGLVSRYYMEVLGGWRDTGFVHAFGKPYRVLAQRRRLRRQRLHQVLRSGRPDRHDVFVPLGPPAAADLPLRRQGRLGDGAAHRGPRGVA
jgi:hypothetical protein